MQGEVVPAWLTRINRKSGNRVTIENGQLLQRLQKHLAGVNRLGFIGAMPGCDELADPARFDVFFKDVIGIVKIRNDDGVSGKELAPLQIERTVRSKEHCEPRRLQRMHGTNQAGIHRHRCNPGIAENLQFGFWEPLTKCGQHR